MTYAHKRQRALARPLSVGVCLGPARRRSWENSLSSTFRISAPRIVAASEGTSGSAITGIAFWDPKDAGLAMNKIAKLLLDGKTVTDGMDLGIKGYDKVKVTKGPGAGIVVKGQAWVDADKSNYKQYPF